MFVAHKLALPQMYKNRWLAAICTTFSVLFQTTMAQLKIVPAPNGTFTVGLSTAQLVNANSNAAFAPSLEPVNLQLSVFYPTLTSMTENVSYFLFETAQFLDNEHAEYFGLDSPNGTFEQLGMVVAAHNTEIATTSNKAWPVLLFSGAAGTTRLFYNSIAAQIASAGYVVVTIDTPYDTDIVQFSDGMIAKANETIITVESSGNATLVEAIAIQDVNYRAGNVPFIIDKLSNNSYTSSLIPGCDGCLNTTHIGVFGHSIGGAAAATATLNDNRLAGAVNFDGELWGDVVNEGLDRPFMIMLKTNQTIDSDPSWSAVWPKLRAKKYALVMADSLHYTYSDIPIALKTLGITPSSNASANEQITDLDAERSQYIIASYTVAFFDQVLKGNASSLLEGPSPQFTEITFDNSTVNTANGTTNNTPQNGNAHCLFKSGNTVSAVLAVIFSAIAL